MSNENNFDDYYTTTMTLDELSSYMFLLGVWMSKKFVLKYKKETWLVL